MGPVDRVWPSTAFPGRAYSLVFRVAEGPKRSSTAAIVNSLVFEARIRRLCEAELNSV